MERSLGELMADERTDAVDDGACPSRHQGRCNEQSNPAGAEEHRHKREHAWMIALTVVSGFLGRRLVRRSASREGGSARGEGGAGPATDSAPRGTRFVFAFGHQAGPSRAR